MAAWVQAPIGRPKKSLWEKATRAASGNRMPRAIERKRMSSRLTMPSPRSTSRRRIARLLCRFDSLPPPEQSRSYGRGSDDLEGGLFASCSLQDSLDLLVLDAVGGLPNLACKVVIGRLRRWLTRCCLGYGPTQYRVCYAGSF